MVAFNTGSHTSIGGTQLQNKPIAKPVLNVTEDTETAANPLVSRDYRDVMAKLSKHYMKLVEESGRGREALAEEIESYDETRDTLFAHLAEIFQRSGLDSSGVGGKIDEAQHALREAAMAIKDEYDHWKVQQNKGSGGQSI